MAICEDNFNDQAPIERFLTFKKIALLIILVMVSNNDRAIAGERGGGEEHSTKEVPSKPPGSHPPHHVPRGGDHTLVKSDGTLHRLSHAFGQSARQSVGQAIFMNELARQMLGTGANKGVTADEARLQKWLEGLEKLRVSETNRKEISDQAQLSKADRDQASQIMANQANANASSATKGNNGSDRRALDITIQAGQSTAVQSFAGSSSPSSDQGSPTTEKSMLPEGVLDLANMPADFGKGTGPDGSRSPLPSDGRTPSSLEAKSPSNVGNTPTSKPESFSSFTVAIEKGSAEQAAIPDTASAQNDRDKSAKELRDSKNRVVQPNYQGSETTQEDEPKSTTAQPSGNETSELPPVAENEPPDVQKPPKKLDPPPQPQPSPISSPTPQVVESKTTERTTEKEVIPPWFAIALIIALGIFGFAIFHGGSKRSNSYTTNTTNNIVIQRTGGNEQSGVSQLAEGNGRVCVVSPSSEEKKCYAEIRNPAGEKEQEGELLEDAVIRL
ncbi:MAG: hypothetical protein HY537_14285, partial [Deltaproteobacteria bacterium]|nr:hypothetical protein [Deltaproteobacteria bacterium]